MINNPDDYDELSSASTSKHKAKKIKPPKKMSETRLANIALHYLERYSSSAENLRRVLERRAMKSARAHPETDMDTVKEWIDVLIKRYIEVGLLNDATYAEIKTRSGLERGDAPQIIAMKLAQKGVAKEISDGALEGLVDDFPMPELQAALNMIRKKRIGPYRTDSKIRAEKRENDLAKLARAGFSYDTAKRMIDADDVEDLISMIEENKN
ncbi:MAG: recombination regulator RecX [Rhodospirillaceae bacterium]|nr:recombination regulator RecX [Rhodospirillaceae bacterium]